MFLSPFSPAIIDVKFPAFTSNNRIYPKFIDINDPETIRKVGMNPKGHIYMISHGFLESGDRPWVKKLMNALLDYEKAATVVVVDWKGGSSPPYYQAVANTRLIGAIVAHVVHSIYVRMIKILFITWRLILNDSGREQAEKSWNFSSDWSQFGRTSFRLRWLSSPKRFWINTWKNNRVRS